MADGGLLIKLTGRIDSLNSSAIEKQILDDISEHGVSPVLDLSSLEYISSAGLRIFLRLQKKHPDMKVIEVPDEIYRTFEMTGFHDILNIKRAFRYYDADSAEEIASGAEGVIYKVDRDTIVKVYKEVHDPEGVQEKIDFAHRAFALGIPSAIPFDVVRFGETFGAVYEMIDSSTLARHFVEEPENYTNYISIYVGILKELHSLEASVGTFPSAKQIYMDIFDSAAPYLEPETIEPVRELIETIPESNHIIHRDLHLGNIMMQGDEPLLIDLDTMSLGDPIFEFAGIHFSYQSFLPENNAKFHRTPAETLDRLWHDVCDKYFQKGEEFIKLLTAKCAVLSSIKQISRILANGSYHDFSTVDEAKEYYLNIIKESLKVLQKS